VIVLFRFFTSPLRALRRPNSTLVEVNDNRIGCLTLEQTARLLLDDLHFLGSWYRTGATFSSSAVAPRVGLASRLVAVSSRPTWKSPSRAAWSRRRLMRSLFFTDSLEATGQATDLAPELAAQLLSARPKRYRTRSEVRNWRPSFRSSRLRPARPTATSSAAFLGRTV